MNNENIKPRLRFAPSPTGGLHIGTARTALFNWLAAKSMAGKLILRIEDTDIKRSNKLFEESIICDLGWLGVTWDEFYRQSDRMESFKDYAYKLLDEGKAYRCFCSPERLEELKSVQYAEGKMSKYDNRCRDLSPAEIENEIAGGKSYAIRFKIEPCEIIFNDLIRGEIRFNSDVFGDFIILKSDGTPSYNFAVVIDDHEMNITHILRGEDHITNTARQILLIKSLRFEIPEFAHLSMILGKDGSKLSKRHGSQTITEFRDEGYVKEALGNYLALLSWAPRTGNEIFNITEITGEFKLSDVSKSPAIFDLDKLNWINGNHIRQKTVDELFKLVLPFILKSQIIEEK
ncbi:MAG: glutamate--tRNA ligase, partial [Candidatus Atribacteria bacterium]|nr:glutamate--tRNA ligase [Candidatus Atribacteria bacterium]